MAGGGPKCVHSPRTSAAPVGVISSRAALDAHAGEAFEQVRGRGGGHRHQPVGAAHESAAQRKGTAGERVDVQLLKGDDRAQQIDDRVDGAHLVKVNLIERLLMHPGLGLAQKRDHPPGPIAGPGRQGEAVDHGHDFAVAHVIVTVVAVVGLVRVAVVVVVAVIVVVVVVVAVTVVVAVAVAVAVAGIMFVVVAVVMRMTVTVRGRVTLHLHPQVHRTDSVPHDPANGHPPRRAQGERLKGLLNRLRVDAQIDQRAQKHVAGHAAEGIDMKVSRHGFRS